MCRCAQSVQTKVENKKEKKIDPMTSGRLHTILWLDASGCSDYYKWPRGHIFLGRKGEALRLKFCLEFNLRWQRPSSLQFHTFFKHKLSNIFITVRNISRLIKSLDLQKATDETESQCLSQGISIILDPTDVIELLLGEFLSEAREKRQA